MWCTGDTCPYLSSFNFFTSLPPQSYTVHYECISNSNSGWKKQKCHSNGASGLPNFEHLQLKARSKRYDKCTRICRSIFILVRNSCSPSRNLDKFKFPSNTIQIGRLFFVSDLKCLAPTIAVQFDPEENVSCKNLTKTSAQSKFEQWINHWIVFCTRSKCLTANSLI